MPIYRLTTLILHGDDDTVDCAHRRSNRRRRGHSLLLEALVIISGQNGRYAKPALPVAVVMTCHARPMFAPSNTVISSLMK